MVDRVSNEEQYNRIWRQANTRSNENNRTRSEISFAQDPILANSEAQYVEMVVPRPIPENREEEA